VVLILC